MDTREKLAEIDRELESFGKSDRELDAARERARNEIPRELSAIDAALELLEREPPPEAMHPRAVRPEAEPAAHQSLSDLLSPELRAELSDGVDGSAPLSAGLLDDIELMIDEELSADPSADANDTPLTGTRPPPPPRSLPARPSRIPSRTLPRK